MVCFSSHVKCRMKKAEHIEKYGADGIKCLKYIDFIRRYILHNVRL